MSHLSYPPDLPIPQDDGLCDHLVGLDIPKNVLLPLTPPGVDRSMPEKISVEQLSQDGPVVIFFYPRTGDPGENVPKEWDAIPGARGCTPQNCSYRDAYHNLLSAGLLPGHLFGCSTQSTATHAELTARLHLPYALLSDEELLLTKALNLPTFSWNNKTLVKRLTLIIDAGKVVKVWYPVFPPDKGVDDVVAWLKERKSNVNF